MAYIIFIVCVWVFSMMSCFSPTAMTYLRDENPLVWILNWILFVCAAVLANIVRLPLGLSDPFWVWAANFGICMASGIAIFFCVLFCAIAYHVFWPLFKSLFCPEH